MISAVVLNHNRASLLRRLLENLKALRLDTSLEVLVVDHGSEHSSVTVATPDFSHKVGASGL